MLSAQLRLRGGKITSEMAQPLSIHVWHALSNQNFGADKPADGISQGATDEVRASHILIKHRCAEQSLHGDS